MSEIQIFKLTLNQISQYLATNSPQLKASALKILEYNSVVITIYVRFQEPCMSEYYQGQNHEDHAE